MNNLGIVIDVIEIRICFPFNPKSDLGLIDRVKRVIEKMIINTSKLSANRIYHTMIQTIIPRPVAWVLSDNGKDDDIFPVSLTEYPERFNLAPFSYFTPVSSKPPILMFSVGKKPDGLPKDTRRNIIEREKFVVHIANGGQAEQVTASSATLDFGESEIKQLDLELQEFPGFSLPRLACCDIAYACELYEVKELGDVPQALIFGLIKQIYISDNLLVGEGIGEKADKEGRYTISAEGINPLARVGGDNYWVNGEVITVERPK